MDNKSKIFIRFMPGGSGNFIANLIFSVLSKKFSQAENIRVHLDREEFSQYHSYEVLQTLYSNNQSIRRLDKKNPPDLSMLAQFVEKNLKFYDTVYSAYVIPTHFINADVFYNLFENVKIVSIDFDDDDILQMTFNRVIKVISHVKNKEQLKNNLEYVQQHYNKLTKYSVDDLLYTDFKLMTYLHLLSDNDSYQIYKNKTFTDQVYKISFKEILNGSIIDRLDDLFDYLNLELSTDDKTKLINMVYNYSKAQIKVPWQLTLDSYE